MRVNAMQEQMQFKKKLSWEFLSLSQTNNDQDSCNWCESVHYTGINPYYTVNNIACHARVIITNNVHAWSEYNTMANSINFCTSLLGEHYNIIIFKGKNKLRATSIQGNMILISYIISI